MPHASLTGVTLVGPEAANERVLWDSKIRLGEDFFNEIISHPVPLDMNTLTALKRSPLGLDLYLWLTYRTFTLRAPQRLSWANLYRQFGMTPDKASDNLTVQNFRKDCLRELKKINLAWPDLNYSTALGVLILLPSVPHISPHPNPCTSLNREETVILQADANNSSSMNLTDGGQRRKENRERRPETMGLLSTLP